MRDNGRHRTNVELSSLVSMSVILLFTYYIQTKKRAYRVTSGKLINLYRHTTTPLTCSMRIEMMVMMNASNHIYLFLLI